MIPMTILFGIFTGGVVACEKRLPFLWLWGIPIGVCVVELFNFYISYGPNISAYGNWMCLIVIAFILVMTLIRHRDSFIARILSGLLTLVGSIGAMVAGFVVAIFLSSNWSLEDMAIYTFPTMLVGFPLGSAGGWFLARKISTQTTRA